MIELVELGNEPIDVICSRLQKENPDWAILDESNLKTIVESSIHGKEEFNDKTFIVPGYIVDKRRHQSRENRLISYMVSQNREKNWNFIIVATGWERVDGRIRDIAKEAKWN